MKHLCCPNIESFDAMALGIEDAKEMSLKLLSEDSIWIDLEPGGYTPEHQHDDKERIIVMAGKGIVKFGEEKKELQPNDFIEFEPNDMHQIINNNDMKLSIMCFRNQL